MTKKEQSFEEAITRLEEVVRKLETGEETMDGSLKLYEEGVSLIRFCTEALEKAEQKVSILRMQPDGNAVLEPFGKEE